MNKIYRKLVAWFTHYRSRIGSYLYIGMAVLSVVGTAFFLSSRSIFVDDSPIFDSKIGLASEQTIGNAKVKIVQRNINSKAGYGEILFEINESTSNNIGQKYQAIIGQVEKDGKHETVLPSTLKKVSEHYYVLQFKNFKPKWHRFLIDFGQLDKTQLIAGKDYQRMLKGDNDQATSTANTKKIAQKPFNIDYRKTKTSTISKPRKKTVYLAEGLTLDLNTNEKKINTVKQDIKKGNKQLKAMYDKIKAIKADEAYQTDADIKDSESQITTIKASIKSTKETLSKAKTALSELYDQQNNLRAKLRRLNHN
ncbi:hypothetical protein FC20_GL000176 [Lactobacillus equicursoris DSM 19284 = JCM 14600 = CIP 110162]|uniref:Uncharacterized protein n=2 Tax=Lactobacillaceae TaxID=33958 RepID=A0A0R1LLP8_9LACO|nr:MULTISPECIES: hypothetical protein [Lactobacillaceae]KRK96854.1 hypothetical protein FC20_GL000176 [Lactobacillus equicursoris DSM 19284 = JCM 14600 = CIP 110162]